MTEAAQFSAALKQKPTVRNARFALHFHRSLIKSADESAVLTENAPERSVCSWRLGLVIPKRFEPSSVRRNAIKRVWREVFRQRRPVLRRLDGGDLVVRLFGPVRATEKTLEQLKRQCHEDAQDLIRQLLERLLRAQKI